MGELLGSPLRYRAGRVGDFVRIEGPPGLRRAVGRVVHLRPSESPARPGARRLRSRSVALEPETETAEDTEEPESDAEEK